MKIFFGRAREVPAPFPPRSGIVADLRVPNQLKDEIEPTRSHTACTVTDDFLSVPYPLCLQHLLDHGEILDGGIFIQEAIPPHVYGRGDVPGPRETGHLFPKIFFNAARIYNSRLGMRLPDKTFQVVLQCDQSPHRLSLVSSQRWRDRSMLERSLLGRPFHPSPVQDTQTLVTQIFQHPKHPPFIAPIVEWIGVDHDVAV